MYCVCKLYAIFKPLPIIITFIIYHNNNNNNNNNNDNNNCLHQYIHQSHRGLKHSVYIYFCYTLFLLISN